MRLRFQPGKCYLSANIQMNIDIYLDQYVWDVRDTKPNDHVTSSPPIRTYCDYLEVNFESAM